MKDALQWLAYAGFLAVMIPYAVIAIAGIGSWLVGFIPSSTDETPSNSLKQ
jgi:hypothetical protein